MDTTPSQAEFFKPSMNKYASSNLKSLAGLNQRLARSGLIDEFNIALELQHLSLSAEDYWEEQMEWLEEALANSSTKWKVVIGHHPLQDDYYGTLFDEHSEFRQILFKHADLYLSGHDHSLQYHLLENSADIPLPQIISGAAHNNIALIIEQKSLFRSDNNGFVELNWDEEFLEVVFIV